MRQVASQIADMGSERPRKVFSLVGGAIGRIVQTLPTSDNVGGGQRLQARVHLCAGYHWDERRPLHRVRGRQLQDKHWKLMRAVSCPLAFSRGQHLRYAAACVQPCPS